MKGWATKWKAHGGHLHLLFVCLSLAFVLQHKVQAIFLKHYCGTSVSLPHKLQHYTTFLCLQPEGLYIVCDPTNYINSAHIIDSYYCTIPLNHSCMRSIQ